MSYVVSYQYSNYSRNVETGNSPQLRLNRKVYALNMFVEEKLSTVAFKRTLFYKLIVRKISEASKWCQVPNSLEKSLAISPQADREFALII